MTQPQTPPWATGHYGDPHTRFMGGEVRKGRSKEEADQEHNDAHDRACERYFGTKLACGHYRDTCRCATPNPDNAPTTETLTGEEWGAILNQHGIRYMYEKRDHWEQPIGADVPGYYGAKWINKPVYRYTISQSDYTKLQKLGVV